MIPTRRLILSLIPVALIGVAVGAGLLPILVWWLSLALLAGVAAADFLRSRAMTVPSPTRDCPTSLSVGRWCTVALTFPPGAAKLAFFDGVPDGFDVEHQPAMVSLQADKRTAVTYRIRPNERGVHSFSAATLRFASPLGLWQRNVRLDLERRVSVFPDFSRVSKDLILGLDRELKLEGIRLSRRRGEGSDFYQLRDYRQGDPLRSLDWNATARTGRLIAKEYREERNQTVLLLIDGGRRMLAQEDELSHFDHVLNAALMLAYVALKHGDSVGAYFFGKESQWIPPRRGVQAIDQLLEGMFDWSPDLVAIDYPQAASDVIGRHRKRAFVVMLTNARDEDTNDLAAAANLLARRNLVFVASLREAVLEEMADGDVKDLNSAIEASAAERYLMDRRRAHLALEGTRATVADTTTGRLASVITNRYLDVKRAGAL